MKSIIKNMTMPLIISSKLFLLVLAIFLMKKNITVTDDIVAYTSTEYTVYKSLLSEIRNLSTYEYSQLTCVEIQHPFDQKAVFILQNKFKFDQLESELIIKYILKNKIDMLHLINGLESAVNKTPVQKLTFNTNLCKYFSPQ